MKNFIPLLGLLLLGALAMPGVYAQDTPDSENSDSRYSPENYRERDQEQLEAYQEGNETFPPKPKNNWALGLRVGSSLIGGDIHSTPNFPSLLGLSVRRALGHVFALRLDYNYSNGTGYDWQPTSGYAFEGQASPWVSNGYAGTIFQNYQIRAHDIGLTGVFTINNVNFYKEQPRFFLYAGPQIGAMAYNTRVDALNSNNNNERYDFSNVQTVYGQANDPSAGLDVGRSEVVDAIQNTLDGEFESQAPRDNDAPSIELGDDQYTVNLFVGAVVGMRYRISRRIDIEAEGRFVVSNDDLLDGKRFNESGGFTYDFDNFAYGALGLSFKIGKSPETFYNTNPLTTIYDETQEVRRLVNRLTDDGDGDGVPDLYDQEPDTEEGATVDAKGVTLDSDRDGVPDDKDAEPYSPKGAIVGSDGKALDEDNDGVPDIYDRELGTEPGAQVDVRGVTIRAGVNEDRVREIVREESGCRLPMIHFRLDKADIMTDFYPELFYISQVMKDNPSLRVRATGHADVRASDSYNMELSQRRVENAVDFISKTYGIDRSRFETDAKGENAPLIPELPANYRNQRLAPLYYINRRVEFECVN